MNDTQLIDAVGVAMHKQCIERGYAAPVEVLIDLGILSQKQYQEWRVGKIPYLESACNVNLRKLSFILHQMRIYAQKHELKPSVCIYKQWSGSKRIGKGNTALLRFSKTGSTDVERWYATHFVDETRVAELKKRRNSMVAEKEEEMRRKTPGS